MVVPLLDLKAQYLSFKEELLPEINQLFDSQLFILGKPVETLEAELAAYCGVEHAVGVASGSDALLLSLMAAGIGPDDEVITTPYTFFATVSAIVRLGARPVLVDIEPRSFNMNPALIEPKVTAETRAILPVHLYGQVAEMASIQSVADAHGLLVIEDAAQAIGAKYRGKGAGALGDAGCLSFFPTKNLGGFGDGGMVVTDDGALAEKIRILRVHGMEPKYVHPYVGINSRLDALQAVVLSVKLRHLNLWQEQRQENADLYHRLFHKAGLVDDGKVVLPPEVHGDGPESRSANTHVYNQYVIRVEDRDRLRAYLGAKGIGTEVYYPIPLHLQECFASLGHGRGDFPESEKAAAETLALPIYPELTDEMQVCVVDRIAAYFKKSV
ncbi:MAG: DegT/DnrJ/EryC1/StrS family aminotransferase [bacterium]|nr:DegT/DnrJ/EryC1/StrS family aminotransferase [bacterium]